MQNFKKKIKEIVKNGLEPLNEGFFYYKNENKEIEKLAKKRAETCKDCVDCILEPIDFLKIKDERIPFLSDKMCNDCGCELPYKLRQSITKCEKWED